MQFLSDICSCCIFKTLDEGQHVCHDLQGLQCLGAPLLFSLSPFELFEFFHTLFCPALYVLFLLFHSSCSSPLFKSNLGVKVNFQGFHLRALIIGLLSYYMLR